MTTDAPSNPKITTPCATADSLGGAQSAVAGAPPQSHGSQSRGTRRSSCHGRIALAAWSAAIAVGWLVVLPGLSSLPSQKEHIDWLREQRIDPSARYYTEVEAMEPILERLNAELTGRNVAAKQKTPGLP